MKNRIRRAFDLTKPNVLNRIQEDVPAPKAPARKKKKRLPDRAVQWIASAASIAIFIGAISGGIVYYRNYFSSLDPTHGNILNSGNTGGLQVPVGTEPQNTVDYDPSEEGMILRACEIIEPGYNTDDAAVLQDMMQVHREWVTEEGMEQLSLRIEYQDCTYGFRFRGDNGALLKISAFSNGVFTSGMQYESAAITSSAAAWIALMDAAPEHFGLTQYASYQVSKINEYQYRVEFDYDGHRTYYVNSTIGTIDDEEYKVIIQEPLISREEAQGMVTNVVLQSQPDCYLWSTELVGNEYRITLCCTDDLTEEESVFLNCFTYYVDARSGAITRYSRGLDKWDVNIAGNVAGAYGAARYGNFYMRDSTHVFRSGLPSYYEVLLDALVSGERQTVYIKIYEFYCNWDAPLEPVGLVGARDVALGMWGVSLDGVHHLEATQEGNSYRVYFESDVNGFKYFIDSNGTVMYDAGRSYLGPVNDGGIGWKAVRDAVLKLYGRSLEELTTFTWNYTGTHYEVTVAFNGEDSVFLTIDAATGELVDNIVVVPDVGLDGARDLALGMWNTPLEDVYWLETSVDGDSYRVYYERDFMAYKYFYTFDGKLTYAADREPLDKGIVDGGIGWKAARDAALESCGYTLEEMIGLGWVYTEAYFDVVLTFIDGGRYYVQVDPTTGEVLQNIVEESGNVDMPVVVIKEEEAILAAMEFAKCLEAYQNGEVEALVVKFVTDESVTIRYQYYVSFKQGQNYHECTVDAESGGIVWHTMWYIGMTLLGDYDTINSYTIGPTGKQVLLEVGIKPNVRHYSMRDPLTGENFDSRTPEPLLERSDAMQRAAQLIGLDTFTSGSVAMNGRFNGTNDFYCVVIPVEDTSFVVLMDAITGEIIDQTWIS